MTEWSQDAHLLEQALVRQGLLGGLLEVVPFGLEDVHLVAALRPLTKAQGLSLGDRVCLALATRLKSPAITTDSAWNSLEAGVEVKVVC